MASGSLLGFLGWPSAPDPPPAKTTAPAAPPPLDDPPDAPAPEPRSLEEEELWASLEGLAAANEIAPAPATPRSARLNTAPVDANERRESTAAKLKWRGALQTHKLVQHFGRRVHESEGSDALLFRHVPAWIRYRRIEGFRYRLVTAIVDPVDAADSMHSGATFLGFPGASGWADKIGSVALHYRGKDWFVFSKILPFPEQRGEIDEHEDVLLLGSTKHVMMVPECIYRAPEPLGIGTSRVTTIKCMGLSARHTVVGRLSPFVLRRGYLAWGHPQTGFAESVAACSKVTTEELQRRMGTWWRRLLAHVRCLADQAFGLLQVEERLSRYPHDPLEPQYYESLLACANRQDPAEERARALMRGRADDPAAAPAAAVGLSMDC
eukprot:scaffold105885_cov48-Phaeocystis_antarctica.AAC.4